MGTWKDMSSVDNGFEFLFPEKYVCSNCFGDPHIQEVITENAEKDHCSYCNKTFPDIECADMNDIFKYLNQCIRVEYGDPNNEGVGWDSREGGWQGVKIWNGFP